VAGDFAGSGTIVDASEGLILTNAHVAAPNADGQGVARGLTESELPPEPREIQISVAPGLDRAAQPRFIGEVVAVDGYADVAIVKITKNLSGERVSKSDLGGLVELSLGDSDRVRTGDDVRILGFPGISESDAVTLTKGVISGPVADDRIGSDRAWLNVDASINAGNSGGLAADSKGHIIGIPTISRIEFETDGPEPVDFARIDSIRPINIAKKLLEAARQGKDYKSPFTEALSGDEKLSTPRLVVPSRGGFDHGCTAAEHTPAAGDGGIAVSVDYEGFPAGHQDLRLDLVDPSGHVVGRATTGRQYPFAFKSKGCLTVGIAAIKDLEPGDYSVHVYLGPNSSAFDTWGFTV
jgi:S1-C subfamily serine protease